MVSVPVTQIRTFDQLMQPEPKPELGEHETGEHDLREGVRLADQQRLHATGRDRTQDSTKAPTMRMSRLTTAITSHRQMAGKAQSDIDADQQRLVGDRVEIGAELAVPAKALGEEAVGGVGQSRQQEQQEGRLHLVGDDQPHDERNEHDAPERKGIGNIHRRSSRRPLAACARRTSKPEV